MRTNSGGAGSASPWSIGEPYDAGDIWTQSISCEEWLTILDEGKYNYVFLYRVDDRFRERFGDAFENPDDVRSQTIYRTRNENGVLTLCRAEN